MKGNREFIRIRILPPRIQRGYVQSNEGNSKTLNKIFPYDF